MAYHGQQADVARRILLCVPALIVKLASLEGEALPHVHELERQACVPHHRAHAAKAISERVAQRHLDGVPRQLTECLGPARRSAAEFANEVPEQLHGGGG